MGYACAWPEASGQPVETCEEPANQRTREIEPETSFSWACCCKDEMTGCMEELSTASLWCNFLPALTIASKEDQPEMAWAMSSPVGSPGEAKRNELESSCAQRGTEEHIMTHDAPHHVASRYTSYAPTPKKIETSEVALLVG